MKRKPKSRFINLAEHLNDQLTRQNEVVSSTVESMLKFVANDSVEQRSDFDEITKTSATELSVGPEIENGSESGTLPRPRISMNPSGMCRQTEGNK